MQLPYFRLALLYVITFFSSYSFAEMPPRYMLSGPDPYHIPSLAESFQNNVRIEVLHNDSWDSLDFTPRDPNEPTAFEDFKDAWKNIGKGIGGGIKYGGKAIWTGIKYGGKGLIKLPEKLADGVDAVSDWFENDTIETTTGINQVPFKGYKENLSEQALELKDSPYQKIHEAYRERIEIMSNENGIHITYEKTYTISETLSPYLEKHSLCINDFLTCNGNVIQHRLHQEILDILTTNCEINRIFSEYQQKALFTDLVTEGADLARELNVQREVVKGFQIADYCRWLNEAEYPVLAHALKQTGAVVVGAAEGCISIGVNTYNIFRHPVETWDGLVLIGDQLGKFLLHGMLELSLVGQHVSFDGAPCDMAYFPLIKREREDAYTKYELQNPDFINDLKILEAYYNHTSQEFAKLPPEEQTRKIVALAFELYFSGKFLRQIGKVKSAAFKHAINPALRTVAQKVELFSYKVVGETCTRMATTCETVENYLFRKANGAEYFYDWVIDENGVWKEVIDVKPIPAINTPLATYKDFTPIPKPRVSSTPATKNFSDVQKSITKNILVEKGEALQFAKNSIIPSASELLPGVIEHGLTSCADIRTFVDQAELDELRSYVAAKNSKDWRENSNKLLKIKIGHLFNIEPKSTNKIIGFHHDYLGSVEERGIITLENIEYGEFGEYSADVIWNGTRTEKTFFPKSWTRKKVLDNIIEAYENYKAHGIKKGPELDGKYLIKGITNSGMEIEMYIDNQCNVLSAYPVIEK